MHITNTLTIPDSQVEQWHKFHSEMDTDIWIDKLPEVVEDLIDRWQMDLVKVLHSGVEGLVIESRIAQQRLVLKIMISARDYNRQIKILELLTAAQIKLAVPLFGHYRPGHALLMPHINGQHPLPTKATDDKLRTCLGELHSSGLHGIRPLSSHWSKRVERTKTRSIKNPLSVEKEQLLSKANKLGTKLAKEKQRHLLHGDIHPQNMILNKDGLTLMDFRGLAGDPAFDFANWAAKTCMGGGFDRKLNDRQHLWFLAHLPAEAQLFEMKENLNSANMIWDYLFDQM